MWVPIEATYKVVTPMFCSGTDPKCAELRAASFKGVLRYWWRALAWLRYEGNLDVIKSQEDQLFGSANGGQSRVMIRLGLPEGGLSRVAKGAVLKIPGTNTPVGQGARYLGYGVMEAFRSRHKGTQAGEITRACLRAPFEFKVRMRVRMGKTGATRLDLGELELLRGALAAVGVFGGMGAKSRKGFGSTVLRSLHVGGEQWWDAPASVGTLNKCVERLGPERRNAELPEYTALSTMARHVLVHGNVANPLRLLDLIGRELVRYRSWGRRGKILGNVDSERNFRFDHNLMKHWQRDRHPQRIAFGLPHNYGRRLRVGPEDRALDRRASPLFIHIHECGDKAVAVLSFLPARFLPRDKSLISVGGQTVRQQKEHDLYRPIHEFLDRLLGRGRKRLREALRAVEVKTQ